MSREPKSGSTKEDRPGKSAKELQAKLQLLPDAPGVYLHKNKQGKVIYVGKASRLNQRVRSYFHTGGDKDAKTHVLVSKIRDFDYIVTDSATDALVLENQLIKEYRPLYNVRLKDDKQYPYILVSLNEPCPRVAVVRRIVKDGGRYFGPFTDVGAMRETLKFAAGAFQVRTCHLDLPGQTVERACLDWQIGRCSAPCVDYDTKEGYRAGPSEGPHRKARPDHQPQPACLGHPGGLRPDRSRPGRRRRLRRGHAGTGRPYPDHPSFSPGG
jgi:excinuclease ABC subunit C